MASFSTAANQPHGSTGAANSAAGVQQISGMQKAADKSALKAIALKGYERIFGRCQLSWAILVDMARLAWHGEPGSSLWSVLVPRGLDVSVANLLEGLRAGVACAVPVFVSHVRKHGV